MKKNLLTLAFVVIVYVMSLATALAQPCPPMIPVSFSNERVIDTASFIKPHDDVAYEKRDFADYFRNQGNNLVHDPEPFSMKAMIDQLYAPITVKMYTSQFCRDRKCIAGVKISHGITGNRMKVLYTPLLMRLKSITFNPQGDTLNAEVIDSLETFHLLPTGQFATLPLAQSNSFKRDYYRGMLKRPTQGAPAPPNQILDSEDAKGVIFSFQEIIKLYHEVYKTEPDVFAYCKKLEVHHACSFYEKKARHTLFITREGWTKLVTTKEARTKMKVLRVQSEDDGANLAHLCPPRCGTLDYPEGQ
jgi:hypothetical protein